MIFCIKIETLKKKTNIRCYILALRIAFSIKPTHSINLTAYDSFSARFCGISISHPIRREILNCCAVEMRNELWHSQAFLELNSDIMDVCTKFAARAHRQLR